MADKSDELRSSGATEAAEPTKARDNGSEIQAAISAAVTSPRKSAAPQAATVSIQNFRDALIRVKGSPKGDVKLSLDVMESYLSNLVDHPDAEKYKEIRMGNREFQWRVKKVDGAFDALLAAGFVHQTDPSGTTSPNNGQDGKAPREYLYWKADGQMDGLKECLQILKQAQGEFEERFNKVPLKSLDGRRYQKELRKEERPSSRFEIGFSDAIGRRNTMEDAMTVVGRFMSRENMDYAAIFDGHGGDEVAELCAGKMHRFLARHLTMSDDIPQALKDAFEEMNSQCKSLPDMGATAVVALALEQQLWIANAGDARAVLSHKTEGAIRLSVDHKPDLPSEKARVLSLGGQVFTLFGCARVNGMLAVSRAIGDASMSPYVTSEPYIASTPLGSDAQFLILACDGVWDVLTDQEAVDIIRRIPSATATRAAQTLVQAAFERNSTDNISVIILFFQSPEEFYMVR